MCRRRKPRGKELGMKIIKIDHVGVAVSDSVKAAAFLTGVLGARMVVDELWDYKGQEFNWAYFEVGEQGRIELISSPDPDNFINRYIGRHGEGLHHVTILVEDLEEAILELESKGISPIDVSTEHPQWKEAFISPKDAFGVLIQLAEYDEEDWGLKSSG